MLRKAITIIIFIATFTVGNACGPIVVYPIAELDTAARHTYNGEKLLRLQKLDAALREFRHAIELDPNYFKAYVGLGLTYGKRGDHSRGMSVMEQARNLAETEEEHDIVVDGFRQLLKMSSPSPG